MPPEPQVLLESGRDRADASHMDAELTGPGMWFWLMLAGVGFMFVQEILAVIACQRRDAVRLHQLRVETHKMRLRVKREMALNEMYEMQQREEGDITVIDALEDVGQNADALLAQADERGDPPAVIPARGKAA